MALIATLGLGIFGIAVETALAQTAAATLPRAWTVERAAEWDALFDRSSGWTGADGIYSIPLSGRDAPRGTSEDATLFVFSDTFVGEVGPDGRRLPGSTLVNNSLALLTGAEPNPASMHFFWDVDESGKPGAVFVPSTPASTRGDWYWLLDGLSLDGKAYLFALRMREGNGGAFNFAVAGVSRLVLPLASPNPVRDHVQTDAPLYVPARDGSGEIVLGAAAMPNTVAAGAPLADGYIYIYGHRNDPLNKKLIASRVRSEKFEDFGEWRYWDGTAWSASIETIAALTDRISSEFSVSPLPDGRFVLVFQLDTLSRDVAIRIGQSPVGPFGPAIRIWRCPEADADPEIYCYNAKAHPHLSGPAELLISYNVNTFDFPDHFASADIYRPRFIRIRLGP